MTENLRFVQVLDRLTVSKISVILLMSVQTCDHAILPLLSSVLSSTTSEPCHQNVENLFKSCSELFYDRE